MAERIKPKELPRYLECLRRMWRNESTHHPKKKRNIALGRKNEGMRLLRTRKAQIEKKLRSQICGVGTVAKTWAHGI